MREYRVRIDLYDRVGEGRCSYSSSFHTVVMAASAEEAKQQAEEHFFRANPNAIAGFEVEQ